MIEENSTPFWYEMAAESLEDDYDNGFISSDDFYREMRMLNEELQQEIFNAKQVNY